jgi:DNA-binding transcriptional LysR family regulator
MLNKLRSMAVFVRVVEVGSFRQAAKRLNLSASVVSHHVTQLETELGVCLLYRSTRHVALTDQGSLFYETCRVMVDAAENALNNLHGDVMKGRLWVIAPTLLSIGPFVSDVADFCKLHPEVDIRLEFDDSPRNLIQEGIDVAICFGIQKNSSLIVRPLLFSKPRHYAAPDYLESNGPIQSLDDLRNARWVTISSSCQESQLTGPDGELESVEIRRRISVNSAAALFKLTIAGLGVAELPPVMVQKHVAAGELFEVLPEWKCADISCCAVLPAPAMPRALSCSFVDFIHARILEKEQQMLKSE